MNEKECSPWIKAPDKLLVLLAGQSNMAGRGYAGPDDLTVIPRLMMIRPDFKWQPAVEQHHGFPRGTVPFPEQFL